MKIVVRILCIAAVVILAICAGGLYYIYQQDKPLPGISLPPLNLPAQPVKLLVFAPHCDDESLGAAALIYDVHKNNGEVKIVAMTNGDGFKFATEEEFHRFYVNSKDYIHAGYNRQQETLAAVTQLGLSNKNVIFLGYPDRGLAHMWLDNWSTDNLYQSPYTGSNHTPYNNSYQNHVAYAGTNVLSNLESIITAFQPNLIIFPHPNDEHPDHWATFAFVTTAITKLYHDGKLTVQPTQYTYLVHRGDFPVPHGYYPSAPLLPPQPLSVISIDWLRYEVNSAMEDIKLQAIQRYSSQIHVPIMSSLMPSFIRTNELYAQIAAGLINAAPLNSDLSQPKNWGSAFPILINSTGETPIRALEPSGNITSVYGYTQNGNLWLRLKSYTPVSDTINYVLQINSFSFHNAGWSRTKLALATHNKPTISSYINLYLQPQDIIWKVPLGELNNPDFMLFNVYSVDHFGFTIDRTAWQIAHIN